MKKDKNEIEICTGALTKIILVVLASYVLVSATAALTKVFSAKEDGLVEELAEEIFEDHTGVLIDFSPSSPENN